jgi:hypothetical protein
VVPRPEDDEWQEEEREKDDLPTRGEIDDRSHRQSDQKDEDTCSHLARACPRCWNGNPALGVSRYR